MILERYIARVYYRIDSSYRHEQWESECWDAPKKCLDEMFEKTEDILDILSCDGRDFDGYVEGDDPEYVNDKETTNRDYIEIFHNMIEQVRNKLPEKGNPFSPVDLDFRHRTNITVTSKIVHIPEISESESNTVISGFMGTIYIHEDEDYRFDLWESSVSLKQEEVLEEMFEYRLDILEILSRNSCEYEGYVDRDDFVDNYDPEHDPDNEEYFDRFQKMLDEIKVNLARGELEDSFGNIEIVIEAKDTVIPHSLIEIGKPQAL